MNMEKGWDQDSVLIEGADAKEKIEKLRELKKEKTKLVAEKRYAEKKEKTRLNKETKKLEEEIDELEREIKKLEPKSEIKQEPEPTTELPPDLNAQEPKFEKQETEEEKWEKLGKDFGEAVGEMIDSGGITKEQVKNIIKGLSEGKLTDGQEGYLDDLKIDFKKEENREKVIGIFRSIYEKGLEELEKVEKEAKEKINNVLDKWGREKEGLIIKEGGNPAYRIVEFIYNPDYNENRVVLKDEDGKNKQEMSCDELYRLNYGKVKIMEESEAREKDEKKKWNSINRMLKNFKENEVSLRIKEGENLNFKIKDIPKDYPDYVVLQNINDDSDERTISRDVLYDLNPEAVEFREVIRKEKKEAESGLEFMPGAGSGNLVDQTIINEGGFETDEQVLPESEDWKETGEAPEIKPDKDVKKMSLENLNGEIEKVNEQLKRIKLNNETGFINDSEFLNYSGYLNLLMGAKEKLKSGSSTTIRTITPSTAPKPTPVSSGDDDRARERVEAIEQKIKEQKEMSEREARKTPPEGASELEKMTYLMGVKLNELILINLELEKKYVGISWDKLTKEQKNELQDAKNALLIEERKQLDDLLKISQLKTEEYIRSGKITPEMNKANDRFSSAVRGGAGGFFKGLRSRFLGSGKPEGGATQAKTIEVTATPAAENGTPGERKIVSPEGKNKGIVNKIGKKIFGWGKSEDEKKAEKDIKAQKAGILKLINDLDVESKKDVKDEGKINSLKEEIDLGKKKLEELEAKKKEIEEKANEQEESEKEDYRQELDSIKDAKNINNLGNILESMSRKNIIKEAIVTEFNEKARAGFSDSRYDDVINYSNKAVEFVDGSNKSTERKDVLIKFYKKVIELAEGMKKGGDGGKPEKSEKPEPLVEPITAENKKENSVKEEIIDLGIDDSSAKDFENIKSVLELIASKTERQKDIKLAVETLIKILKIEETTINSFDIDSERAIDRDKKLAELYLITKDNKRIYVEFSIDSEREKLVKIKTWEEENKQAKKKEQPVPNPKVTV